MKKRAIPALGAVLAVLVLALIGGCEFFPGNTVTVYSSAVNDGEVGDNGSVANGTSSARVGDDWSNTAYRAFVDFTFWIPPGADALDATLRVYDNGVTGDPYFWMDRVYVDRVFYGMLDQSDYSLPFSDDIGILSSDGPAGWRSIDVTAQVQDEVTGDTGRIQFRIYRLILAHSDGVDENDRLAMGEDTEYAPELTIRHQE
jgi:hypothetical protein